MTRITDPDAQRAVDEALGLRPARMTTGEAAFELAVAETFRRDPDPRAVEAQGRVKAAQEAVADLAPWRAAVRWDQYDDLAALEERFARLASSRRGQSIEAARGHVAAQLREAWAKGGTSTSTRFAAVEKAIREGIAHFERLSAIATAPQRSTEARSTTSRRTLVTEADFDKAVARTFGREVNR